MRRSTALFVAGWLAAGAMAGPMGGPARADVGTPKVAVIVLENKDYTDIVGDASAPYLNGLIAQGLLFTNYHAQVKGSAPNYRAMIAGSVAKVPPLTDNIFKAFDQASRDWTEFEESMTGNCGVTNQAKVPGTTQTLYVPGHDPAFVFKGNESCATNDVPLTSDAQLQALPEFSYIVPNACDDMHTRAKNGACPAYFGPVGGTDVVEMGDNWLNHVVPVLLSDPGTTVIITFDEGVDAIAQHIFTLEVGAGVTPGTDAQHYDHFGLLAGLYGFFGLGPPPNQSATATPLPIAPDANADPRLTVEVEGPGSVTSSPPGISCGTGQVGTCAAPFASGTLVTLSETPDSSTFDGWTGDCSGTGTSCVVTMDTARSVTASFGTLFTLTVVPPTDGRVTSDIGGINCQVTSCTHDFAPGTAVSLTPHAHPGFVFTGWGGDCLGAPTTCALTMDAAKSVSATFGPVPQHTLTVATDGTGQGSVTSNVGAMDCPTACSADFDDGQVVILTRHVGVNSAFTGWSGACSGVSATCSVTMDAPKSATATFDTAPSVLTLDDDDLSIAYNGWVGVADATASGGAYRVSDVVNDKATWKSPKATSLTWIAHSGPDAGKADVTIDGKNKGTVDLYSPTPGKLSKTFGGLTRKVHTVIVKVAGAKNPASTGTNVSVDAFSSGAKLSSESDPSVTFDTWAGAVAGNALGGAYRSSTASSATVTLTFTGTAIDWITTKGPAFGKAAVRIDGVPMGTVDLYKAAQVWQSVVSYGGLGSGVHSLEIQVLGTKNPASNGTKVFVDAFKIHA